MRLRIYAALLVALFALPIFVSAQTDIYAQIRADLLSDPRTAELTEAEIDALVEALADEATETGVAEEYIEAKNVPDYSGLFTESIPVPVVGYNVSPLNIAVVFLSLVLLAVGIYVVRRGRGLKGKAFDADSPSLTNE
jgi:hypothetical protein